MTTAPANTAPAERIEEARPLIQAICRAMQERLDRLDLGTPPPTISDPAQAAYSLARDPASGHDSLALEWRDAHGHKQGSLVIHADGSFYAEHDVLRMHPARPDDFIEAATAWGRDGGIKTELRCLAMPK